MWKLEHGNGRREINELHVPQGQPVELILASEDAIHSFYVPAFRLKQDAVPGRLTHLWFTATRLGEFRLFCSEFCGSEHAGMVGKVTVMPAAEYARWLDAGPAEPGMVQQGFALYRSSGCSGCHDAGSTVHAPLLQDLYGRTVHLQDGRNVTADDNYLRDSIVLPARDVVAGFAPVMPSYAGQFDEEQLQQLVAYLRAGAPCQPVAPRTLAMTTSYLTDGLTLRSWLTTHDHKRIAILYAIAITFFFFIGGAAATLIRLQLATPDRHPHGRRQLQQGLHRPRGRDGVAVPDPVDPLGDGQLHAAAHDRRARPRAAAHQPAELVPLHLRRRLHAAGPLLRRRRHRLDLLHALRDDVLQRLRRAHAGRHLHHRLLVDRHRA